MPSKLTDQPLHLPDINNQGNTALRQWRHDRGYNPPCLAAQLGISVATLCRYETSGLMSIAKANDIVKLTRGAVRYRDLIGGFKPEYA